MDVNVIPFGDNEMERETERVASVAVAVAVAVASAARQSISPGYYYPSRVRIHSIRFPPTALHM